MSATNDEKPSLAELFNRYEKLGDSVKGYVQGRMEGAYCAFEAALQIAESIQADMDAQDKARADRLAAIAKKPHLQLVKAKPQKRNQPGKAASKPKKEMGGAA